MKVNTVFGLGLMAQALVSCSADEVRLETGGLADTLAVVDAGDVRGEQAPDYEVTEDEETGVLRVHSEQFIADFAPGTSPEYIERMTRKWSEQFPATSELGESEVSGGSQDFQIATRWPGGALGDPIKLSWSLVPDGTSTLTGPSSLFARFDTLFGSRAAWLPRFQDAFGRWDELTGIDFSQVVVANDADDGAPFGVAGAPALRGDLRVCAAFVDGPAVLQGGGCVSGCGLAFAQLPNMTAPGEITLDRDENWLATPWTAPFGAGLGRTLTHEIGHGIGLNHVCPNTGTKLMEPFTPVQIGYYGPQHDDLRGGQELYGDPFEPNDDLASAAPFSLPLSVNNLNLGAIPFNPNGSFGPQQLGPRGLMSLDSPNDVDVYSVSFPQPTHIQLVVRPIGLIYQNGIQLGNGFCEALPPSINSDQIADLKVEILDRTGVFVLAEEDTTIFSSVIINYVFRDVGVPYFIRVTPIGNPFVEPQTYEMVVNTNPSGTCTTGSCDDFIFLNGVESCNGSGCAVTYQADCNGNFIEDAHEITFGLVSDCNNDGIPDECQTDCNGNGVLDACDIQNGFSMDQDGNLVPDECQGDCNGNGIVDTLDLQNGTSLDSNLNGIPDECETTWRVPDDFPTLNAAIQNAGHGDTILVAPGTYTGPQNTNLTIRDKTLQIIGESGALNTIIDMNLGGRAFVIEGTDTFFSNRTRIEGFWIRDGQATNLDPHGPYGGAILIRGGNPRIERCYFSNNHAADSGGAIAATDLDGEGSAPRIVSCMFYANIANWGGAAYALSGGSPVFVNCTFAVNAGLDAGGALGSEATFAASAALVSCIVWDNYPADSQLDSGIGLFITRYCALPLEHPEYSGGIGNRFEDPGLVNAGAGNLHIRYDSPCRNAGDPTFNFFFPPGSLDIDGDKRIKAGRIEIGADELRFNIQMAPPL